MIDKYSATEQRLSWWSLTNRKSGAVRQHRASYDKDIKIVASTLEGQNPPVPSLREGANALFDF